MPRGQASIGTWNFHVSRYICPDCKRKGLYSMRFGWCCMYKNCASKKSSGHFRKQDDKEVLELNPILNERAKRNN